MAGLQTTPEPCRRRWKRWAVVVMSFIAIVATLRMINNATGGARTARSVRPGQSKEDVRRVMKRWHTGATVSYTQKTHKGTISGIAYGSSDHVFVRLNELISRLTGGDY